MPGWVLMLVFLLCLFFTPLTVTFSSCFGRSQTVIHSETLHRHKVCYTGEIASMISLLILLVIWMSLIEYKVESLHSSVTTSDLILKK